ncbi:MAG: hypothetical protein L0H44_07100, partial [Yaniella sp.]|nr:hypothetical protein [Yaniella sp.]
MNARFSKSKVLKDLKKGPNSSSPPETAHLVATAASHPKQFANVLSKLFYSMVDEPPQKFLRQAHVNKSTE